MEAEKNFDPKLKTCLFCDSSNIKLYDIDYNNINIYKCHNCNMKFMNPQYNDIYLNKFYATYTETIITPQLEESYIEAHDFYISLVEKYIAKGKFLSVGCGIGIELEVAKKRGWQVNGYDVNINNTQQLQNN